MGFCSSYSKFQRLEEIASASVAPGLLGGDSNRLDMTLFFVADNVDIVTLDGKETFYGMGMMAAITPGKQVSHSISDESFWIYK